MDLACLACWVMKVDESLRRDDFHPTELISLISTQLSAVKDLQPIADATCGPARFPFAVSLNSLSPLLLE